MIFFFQLRAENNKSESPGEHRSLENHNFIFIKHNKKKLLFLLYNLQNVMHNFIGWEDVYQRSSGIVLFPISLLHLGISASGGDN